MNVNDIEKKITSKTKAIMAVHIYGHPVDMDPLLKIASENNLIVIEDAVEVHGAEYRGKKCGSLGHVSSFSFYANKLITTGEGGMVLTDDKVIADQARKYRNLFFGQEERFQHEVLGYNFRMTNLQAAIGLAQMEHIYYIVEKKTQTWRVLQRTTKVSGNTLSD